MPHSTSSRTTRVNSQINRLADEQAGVVARFQLIRLGISSDYIEGRVHTGFMSPVDRGVYFVGRGPMSDLAIWRAAVLSAGPSALLCGRSAAALHGFVDEDRVIDVRCPWSKHRYSGRIRPPVGRSRAVQVRRFRSIESASIMKVEGIRIVTPAVALVQMAESATAAGLRDAYLGADMKGLLSDEDLSWLLESKPGVKGAGRLRQLVAKRNSAVAFTASLLEAKFPELCDEAEVPPPEVNAPAGRYRVDFIWPAIRLVVELDGTEFHRGVAKNIEDRERENDLVAAGLAVLRFNWNQVVREREKVVAQLRAAYWRRAGEVAG